ncbi:MAG: sel1 repeat family protein [Parasporobacterium sp.]|nr:sel1 repeat family protein [Parasporobacterium sp.]
MFRQNDWVKIEYGEYAGCCGRISAVNTNGSYKVLPYDYSHEPGPVTDMDGAALLPIRPFEADPELLKRLVRAECFYRDIADRVFPEFNIKASREYLLTSEDVSAALGNINRNPDCLNDFREWFWLIQNVFYDSLQIKERSKPGFLCDAPSSDDELFATVYNLLDNLYWKLEERYVAREETARFIVTFDEEPEWQEGTLFGVGLEETAYRAVCSDIISRITTYDINKKLPRDEWQYSDSQKRHIISLYEDEDLGSASKAARSQFREFVDDLAEKGDVQALKIIGWSFYEGSPVYRQSYRKAEKYLLKLFNKTGDPYAANALGHISYYGYNRKNVPDYEKAFKYYTLGALAGLDESICRLGDMLIYGRGTVRNLDTGMNLIVDGYKDAMMRFCDGEYDNRFPDYAYRMGNICRENLIMGMGARDSYKFYLEARYALNKCMETEKGPVDEKLLQDIEEAIKDIVSRYRPDPDRTVLRADFPIYISHFFEDRFPVKITISSENGRYYLKMARFRLIPGEESELLVTFPELSFVKLTSEIKFWLEETGVIRIPDKGETFLADGFSKNEHTNALEFYSAGECIAAVEAKWFVIDVTEEKKSKGGAK